ncbi:hypothetical protein ACFQ8C_29275 [Streptomyces sp. NPDC056503]|uniref:hypothetical protein n=1 Tax=Streptomyces sp. NPDC056503 TaxID=3345842 RepID=UPI0036A49BC7
MTLHWGFAYAPPGGDLATAVQEARSAGSRPADDRHGTGKIVVKTAASAALNTVAFDVPDVPARGTVYQQMRVHAVDAGRLTLGFRIAEGQLWHWPGRIPLGNVTTDPGASCSYRAGQLHVDAMNLDCRVEPGKHTIGYELTAPVDLKSLGFHAVSRYDIYDADTLDSTVVQRSKPFTVFGKPAFPIHHLLARDTTGKLWKYTGTRNASAPFYARDEIGGGWQTYHVLTSLSPYEQGFYYLADRKPSAVTRGLGDVVARDASGVLWYYDRQLGGAPYAPRVKVGGGWNTYDQLF